MLPMMAFATMLASRWYNTLLLALIKPFGPFLLLFMLSLFSSILLGAWDLDVSVSWCLAITVSLDYISSCWVAAGQGWDAITEGFATSPQLWAYCAEDGDAAHDPISTGTLQCYWTAAHNHLRSSGHFQGCSTSLRCASPLVGSNEYK